MDFVLGYALGRGTEEKWSKIYIEAPESEARVIFYNRFGHNPERVTCTCCGEDYSISEGESLDQLTAFHRGCNWSESANGYVESKSRYATEYLTMDEYLHSDDAKFIPESEIADSERIGEVPRQGYVWVD